MFAAAAITALLEQRYPTLQPQFAMRVSFARLVRLKVNNALPLNIVPLPHFPLPVRHVRLAIIVRLDQVLHSIALQVHIAQASQRRHWLAPSGTFAPRRAWYPHKYAPSDITALRRVYLRSSRVRSVTIAAPAQHLQIPLLACMASIALAATLHLQFARLDPSAVESHSVRRPNVLVDIIAPVSQLRSLLPTRSAKSVRIARLDQLTRVFVLLVIIARALSCLIRSHALVAIPANLSALVLLHHHVRPDFIVQTDLLPALNILV
jgi:hypothetical protein